VWDETLKFEVAVPNLAMVYFKVMDHETHGKDVVVAVFAAPFHSLRQGNCYFVVTLQYISAYQSFITNDAVGTQVLNVLLVCMYIKVTELSIFAPNMARKSGAHICLCTYVLSK
jgi:hypothetical protein